MAYIKFCVNEKLSGSKIERLTQDYPEYIMTRSIAETVGSKELPAVSGQEFPKTKEETKIYAKNYKRVLSIACGAIVLLFGIFAIKTELPGEFTGVFEELYENIGKGYEWVYDIVTEKSKGTSDEEIFEKTHVQSEYIALPEVEQSEEEITENSFFGSMIEKSTANFPEETTQTQVFSEQNYGDMQTAVMAMNLSRGSDKVYSSNETKLNLDTEALARSQYPIRAELTQEPLVLILHTHGTECYIDSTPDGQVRSTDTSKNVVRVGSELATILNDFGIPTIHSQTMHDELSYITAYNSSKKEAQEYLAAFPSIKYIIDLHRDALPDSGTSRVKGVCKQGGEDTAQLMFVVGTNAGGGNHPNYLENLTVTSHIQAEMNSLYPGLARPINVRNVIFNQNICSGSFILEVGSDANTLEEALSAIELFGRAFAGVVLENSVI